LPQINVLYLLASLALFIGVSAAYFLGARRTLADTASSRAIAALQAENGVLKDQAHRMEVQLEGMRTERAQMAARLEDLSSLVRGIPDWQLLHASMAILEESVKQILKVANDTGTLASKATEHYRLTERLLTQSQELLDLLKQSPTQ
jgi:hypothetical protein